MCPLVLVIHVFRIPRIRSKSIFPIFSLCVFRFSFIFRPHALTSLDMIDWKQSCKYGASGITEAPFDLNRWYSWHFKMGFPSHNLIYLPFPKENRFVRFENPFFFSFYLFVLWCVLPMLLSATQLEVNRFVAASTGNDSNLDFSVSPNFICALNTFFFRLFCKGGITLWSLLPKLWEAKHTVIS